VSPVSISLAGHGATVADVVAVARQFVPVALSEAARARVAAARVVVDRLAQGDRLIYGVNSALGANTGQPIAPDEQSDYQIRAVRARAVGVGPALATDLVRAMLFARAAAMAVGGSGVSPEVLEALLAFLNARVHPRVPAIGSIGVADLAPLSHLALPLFGEGEAEFEGKVLPGAEALARAGLEPVALAAKDGLALISSNAATVGCAALVLHDAVATLDTLNVAAAVSCEGFRANLSPLDPRVQAARPAPLQAVIAQRMTELLSGSALWQADAARRVQDPLSFRCITQVHGAALAALRTARDHVELELNSAADSPLVLIEDSSIVSNGNFHVPGLALALDSLGIALAQVAGIAVQRCLRLSSSAVSGLPLQLTRRGPGHSGFATLQKTLTALYNTIRHRANPGSLDFLPVSESIEDHAPMTFNVVSKTADIVVALRYIAACELLMAAQAIDLRAPEAGALGAGVHEAYASVRRVVPMLDRDRPLGPDADAIAAQVAAGKFGGSDLL
jgi:histidine ammonia-lyase